MILLFKIRTAPDINYLMAYFVYNSIALHLDYENKSAFPGG